jgi:hypothetical protein
LDTCDVCLAAVLDGVGETRSSAKQDRQDAFRKRVERASMANALLTCQASDAGYDIV